MACDWDTLNLIKQQPTKGSLQIECFEPKTTLNQRIVEFDRFPSSENPNNRPRISARDWKDQRDVGGNWKLVGKPVAQRAAGQSSREGSRKKNSSVMITGYRWRGLFLTTTLFYRYCGVAGVLMRYTIACWLLNKKYESKMAAFAAIRHREA